MLTYKMNFKATIESINTENKQMVVEYFDPHGHNSIRLSIDFKYDSTAEELNQLIINNTPHDFFHKRNLELTSIKENNIDQTALLKLVGNTMEYKLPSFETENEII